MSVSVTVSLPDYNFTAGSAQATPGIDGDVWLTTGKALFYSTDSGKSFKALSNGDPRMYGRF